jgi:hypothetical protein
VPKISKNQEKKKIIKRAACLLACLLVCLHFIYSILSIVAALFIMIVNNLTEQYEEKRKK